MNDTTTGEAPATLPSTMHTPEPQRFDLKRSWSLRPETLEEAMRFAEIMARSDLVPDAYKGKPQNILVAVQMGAEVGLSPMQAVQNIAVINNHPSVWGDAIGALIMSHPLYEWMQERWDDSTQTAICVMKRRGNPARTQTFSRQDAADAGLLGKSTYKQHLRRMCERRARARCAQDVFPDALKGLVPAEEALDYIRGEYEASAAPEQPPPLPGGSSSQGNAAVRERMGATDGKGKGKAERKAAPPDDPEAGEPVPEVDAESVRLAIEGAEDFDALNEATAHIKGVADENQRAELRKLGNARAKALAGGDS